jgi:hypothetical protein
VAAVRTGQRPVFPWNDPLNIFVRQFQHTLHVATPGGPEQETLSTNIASAAAVRPRDSLSAFDFKTNNVL